MRKGVKIIRDPEAIKVGIGKTKSRLLSLLKEKDMSILELSDALGKDRSTVYRHIHRLEDAGFVEIVGERKDVHVPEKVYGRTADIFLMTTDNVDDNVNESSIIEWELGDAKKLLKRMDEMGYKHSNSEDLAARISEFFSNFSEESKQHFEHSSQEMGLLEYFKLKLLMLLLESKNHPELEEYSKKIVSDFKSKG